MFGKHYLCFLMEYDGKQFNSGIEASCNYIYYTIDEV